MVALGSALGGAGRYAVSLVPARGPFPVLTLAVNLLGAVLIGFIAGLAAQRPDLSKAAVLFWKTGVCGGFTTFSTFSLEAYELLQGRQYWTGSAYVAISVAGCLAGILCGQRLSRVVAGR